MDAKRTSPTDQEFRALYEAAQRFREREPWRSLSDADLFGIRDPETGIVGYCCVMGALGEYFALNVYLGGEGLAGYWAIADLEAPGSEEPDPLAMRLAALSQKSLALEFTGAQDLARDDKALIRRLGFQFRGANAWPLFARNDPGCEPRPLDAWEVRFLTAALEQALVVHASFVRDEDYLVAPLRQDRVRVRRLDPAGREWLDEEEPFEDAPPIEAGPLEPALGAQLAALPQGPLRLQLAYSFLPAMVKEPKAPRGEFPRVLLLVESARGTILGSQILPAGEFPEGLTSHVAKMLLATGAIPRQLTVSNPWLHEQLGRQLPLPAGVLKLTRHIRAAEHVFVRLTQSLR